MDRLMAQREIARIRREIQRHSDLYYNQAAPEISDFEFDALERRLRELEAEFPEFSAGDSPSVTVGADTDIRFASLEHSRAMLSLMNSYDDQEVAAFDRRVRKDLDTDQVTYTVEPKMDGVALAVRYSRGKLTVAVTRGDGRRGDVITANASTIESLPGKLDPGWESAFPDDAVIGFEARGEVFLTLSRFAELNEERLAQQHLQTAARLDPRYARLLRDN